jgi:hypothetical protein
MLGITPGVAHIKVWVCYFYRDRIDPLKLELPLVTLQVGLNGAVRTLTQ